MATSLTKLKRTIRNLELSVDQALARETAAILRKEEWARRYRDIEQEFETMGYKHVLRRRRKKIEAKFFAAVRRNYRRTRKPNR